MTRMISATWYGCVRQQKSRSRDGRKNLSTGQIDLVQASHVGSREGSVCLGRSRFIVGREDYNRVPVAQIAKHGHTGSERKVVMLCRVCVCNLLIILLLMIFFLLISFRCRFS